MLATKNPRKSNAGLRGARRRWGEPRCLNLRDLTDPQRRLVLALVEAARIEAARQSGQEQEVTR
jgi:hypothetical protein